MKYILILLIILIAPLTVLAQNANGNLNANANANASVNDTLNVNFSQATNFNLSVGLSPESKLYFLKKWKEGIEFFFTFDAEKKIEKRLKFSEIRLAEYGQLLDKGNIDKASQILNDYQTQADKIQSDIEKLKKAKKNVDAISAKVSERIVKHQEVMSRVYQKAPEPAKQALQKVLQKAEDKLPGFLERLTNPDVMSGAINKAKTIKNQVQNQLTNEDLE
ncbi:hypothetical protein EPN15_04805 [Patescibacteria group bacterium]|nr:MAG: hypothetical protein EPN15_04805 [Patescibacteria group bacterium]